MRPALGWRWAGVALLLASVALAALAFTRFDGGAAPAPGSPGFREHGAERVRDAQASVVLGLAAAGTLLASFACHQRAARGRRARDAPQP